MAQINLLKQTSTSNNLLEAGPKIFVRVFVVVLLVLAAYYAWLYIDSKSIDNQIVEQQVKINKDKEEALGIPHRDQLLTRQQQVKDLETLIGAHLYWSQLFKPLAEVTLKTASYSSLRVAVGGELTLSVTVPTLNDLDKYMQVFDKPEFNKNFSDIRIAGFSKVQTKTATAIQFSVRMKYNPAILQYQAQASN